jgi:hypothetical protein
VKQLGGVKIYVESKYLPFVQLKYDVIDMAGRLWGWRTR